MDWKKLRDLAAASTYVNDGLTRREMELLPITDSVMIRPLVRVEGFGDWNSYWAVGTHAKTNRVSRSCLPRSSPNSREVELLAIWLRIPVIVIRD